jgi:transcriptional regulator with XRE-family HTH domain
LFREARHATLADMSSSPSPAPNSVARIELGERLHELRSLSGLTGAQVKAASGIDPGSLSRYEKGERRIAAGTASKLLTLYGASERDREDVLTLIDMDAALSVQKRKTAWWRAFTAVLTPTGFDGFLSLERSACRLRNYELSVVHGRLQTREYAELVVSGMRPELSADDVRKLVDVREKRQREAGAGAPVEFQALLDESALRRPDIDPAVMRGQLQRLLRESRNPGNVIRVLPAGAGFHPGKAGSFLIMSFPEARRQVAWVELCHRSLCFESPADVDAYERTFTYLWNRALTPEATRTLFEQVLKELS